MFKRLILLFITVVAILIGYKVYDETFQKSINVKHNKTTKSDKIKPIIKDVNKKVDTTSKSEPKKENTTKNTQVPKIKNLPLEESLEQRLSTLNAFSGDPIFIRIFKKENLLELWIKPKDSKKYKLLKEYPICYYSGKLGPKLKEGDGQAPEGFYKVYKGSLNPNSSYHLSFNLGFPNRYDRAHNRTGSYLMVHGNCVSIGCYAMGDRNIEDIYQLVEDALKNRQKHVDVHIFPFKMNRLKEHKSCKWYNFWKNLKEGYNLFEKTNVPPKISVRKKRYIVHTRQ